MRTQKLSISIDKPLYDFIGNYQEQYHCKSRSDVINKALYLLQQEYLKSCYKEANNEIPHDFETTSLDGLENETW